MDTFSMNVIAQTLSSHAEMIAPGVMGINFMKPEKPINTMSEVYKLVQEEEQNKVRSPTPTSGGGQPIFRPSKIPPSVAPKPVFNSAPAPAPVQNQPAPPPPAPAPAPKPPVLKPMAPPPAPNGPSQGPCSDCGRNIVGPFVSLSDRTLHQDCFNCSTCGTTLQNVGFHNINNKLYCETHAKLAARVIASSAASAGSPTRSFSPVPAPQAPAPQPPMQAPLPKPIQDLPRTPLAPQAPVAPPPLQSSIPQPVPTPFGQNLVNLPHSPSSSGNLAFRSISPQPFKRISGEFHRVNAPSSPTPGSAPSAPLAYSSGPLPFEMKPYMPPDQTRSSLFSSVSESTIQQSSTEISSQTTTQMTQQQVVQQQQQQRTTQMTQQQSSVYSMDYKQVVGGQSKTKFVWPPQRSEFEQLDGSQSMAPQGPQPFPTYSPLATQTTPSQQDHQPPAFRSVQGPLPSQETPAPAAAPAPVAPPTFSVPPLPSTFPAEPPKAQDAAPPAPASIPPAPAPAYIPPAAPAPAPVRSQPPPPGFAPVLPPVVDAAPAPSSAPAQPGVPTGAGSKPAPKKGRGQLMSDVVPGRIPICGDCGEPIRGPFIIALNRTWCPDHFHCNNLHCKAPLIDVGFVEEQGQLYCEQCYEQFLAPLCSKCNVRIKGDCLNALDRQWHPECFICGYCNKPFGNNSFYLEDGLPYCEKDWNELFTTKCISCGFPIEAGDRWVEALNNNYHSQCFKCSVCQKNLEGQSFYAKGGKPFCKAHAR